jgi:hypothetical protein
MNRSLVFYFMGEGGSIDLQTCAELVEASHLFRLRPLSLSKGSRFNPTVTTKLTTAPKAARTTVLYMSDDSMFITTVKTVPETAKESFVFYGLAD